jgi:hypothetical protein
VSEAPKLWRIIARRTEKQADGTDKQIQHEFITEGDTLNEVLLRHDLLLSQYNWLDASAVIE